jgi:hypothetical protein
MGWSGRGECLDVSERNQNFLAASGTIGMAHHAPPLLVPFRSAVTAPQNPGPTPVKEKPRRRHSTAGQVRREGSSHNITLSGQNDRLTTGHLWISRHRHQPEINEPIGSATPRPKSAAPPSPPEGGATTASIDPSRGRLSPGSSDRGAPEQVRSG